MCQIFFATSLDCDRLGRIAGSALLAVALAACSSKPEATVEPNILPANYRADVISYLQRTLDDPSGIRDAFIAEPALKPSGTETRFIVCLRYNAKNINGDYAGSKDRAAFFYAGRITTVADATKEQCGNAPYQPFPELQKLCRQAVCAPAR